jgi:adenylate cyclase
LAEGGGISISGTVYDHIENKLALGYESLGEHTVKNIKKPVRVYRVLMEPGAAAGAKRERRSWLGQRQWAAPAVFAVLVVGAAAVVIWNFYVRPSPPPEVVPSDKIQTLELPDKPSIAVLPFTNMSDDPNQEYFSDGITEDLITDLSKISGLFVIARNSVFIYKGKAVKIAEVGRALGVRYVLEGSVRKANGRVRITAQLADATTERHLWAERYDRDLKDIFSLQDEVAQKIVAALAVKLTEDEEKRLVRKYTDNMEAYDSFLQGLGYKNRYTKEANVQARQLYERAIDLDPEFALAYAFLGLTYFHEWSLGWTQDPQSLEQAFELAQRAIALDDSLPEAHAILGEVYLWKKQHDEAIAELEKTVALRPNDADGIVRLGNILNWTGRPEEAIGLVRKAIRLNPMYPIWYLWNLGHAYFLTGHYEEAVETLNRVLDRNPDFLPAHVYLTCSYVELGRHEEARAEAAEVMKLNPQTTSTEAWRQRVPYKDQAALERLFEGLRKAGVK